MPELSELLAQSARGSLALLVFAVGWVLSCIVLAEEKSEADRAREFLRRDCRLWQIDSGNLWIVDAERRVREDLEGIGKLRAAIITLQTRLDERIEQNRQQWQTGELQLESLRQDRVAVKNDEAKRKALDRQIAELQQRLVPPDELGGVADVQALAINLTNQRLAMGISLLELRRLVPGIAAAYPPLAGDPRVIAALEAVGARQRLGPIETDYTRAVKALREEVRLAFDSPAPVFLQHDNLRVGGILNERIPVLFTWLESQEPTIVPLSLLQAAGIDVPAHAPELRMAVGPERDVRVRAIVIPELRLAGATIRQLEAYALHPDREDLGAQIGTAAFADHSVTLEQSRLRLTIRAR